MSAAVVRMTMNTADFGRVLQQVAAESSRTFPEFLNGQAFRLATLAVRETEKADANKIAWQLGQTSKRTVNKRTGAQLKTAKRVYAGTAASLSLYKILNWRRKRAGKEPLGGKEMSGPARKFRAAALRSTGFIGSGWVWSIRELAKTIGIRPLAGTKLPKVGGAAKGYANPARFALSGVVTSEIGNTSLLAESSQRTGSRPGRPMVIAARGLGVAMNLTAKDMLAHLARKLQPVLDRHSAK
jgi:hypothetical protein